jgi:hypothetical protein
MATTNDLINDDTLIEKVKQLLDSAYLMSPTNHLTNHNMYLLSMRTNDFPRRIQMCLRLYESTNDPNYLIALTDTYSKIGNQDLLEKFAKEAEIALNEKISEEPDEAHLTTLIIEKLSLYCIWGKSEVLEDYIKEMSELPADEDGVLKYFLDGYAANGCDIFLPPIQRKVK